MPTFNLFSLTQTKFRFLLKVGSLSSNKKSRMMIKIAINPLFNHSDCVWQRIIAVPVIIFERSGLACVSRPVQMFPAFRQTRAHIALFRPGCVR